MNVIDNGEDQWDVALRLCPLTQSEPSFFEPMANDVTCTRMFFFLFSVVNKRMTETLVNERMTNISETFHSLSLSARDSKVIIIIATKGCS